MIARIVFLRLRQRFVIVIASLASDGLGAFSFLNLRLTLPGSFAAARGNHHAMAGPLPPRSRRLVTIPLEIEMTVFALDALRSISL